MGTSWRLFWMILLIVLKDLCIHSWGNNKYHLMENWFHNFARERNQNKLTTSKKPHDEVRSPLHHWFTLLLFRILLNYLMSRVFFIQCSWWRLGLVQIFMCNLQNMLQGTKNNLGFVWSLAKTNKVHLIKHQQIKSKDKL